MPDSIAILTSPELSTILAALRHWQEDGLDEARCSDR